MGSHEEHRAEQQRDALADQPDQRKGHHEDLENLHRDGDGPLAVAVGQEATGHGKQDERQGKQGPSCFKFDENLIFDPPRSDIIPHCRTPHFLSMLPIVSYDIAQTVIEFH